MHPLWHVCVCVARTWISYRCVPCHQWCTHRTSIVVKNKKKTKKTLFQFSCGCEQFHYGRSFGFLVTNVCNHWQHYETPCIIGIQVFRDVSLGMWLLMVWKTTVSSSSKLKPTRRNLYTFMYIYIAFYCNFSIKNIPYRSADKSLARPGRKQAAPVKSVMAWGVDWFGYCRDRWWTLVNAVMNLQVP